MRRIGSQVMKSKILLATLLLSIFVSCKKRDHSQAQVKSGIVPFDKKGSKVVLSKITEEKNREKITFILCDLPENRRDNDFANLWSFCKRKSRDELVYQSELKEFLTYGLASNFQKYYAGNNFDPHFWNLTSEEKNELIKEAESKDKLDYAEGCPFFIPLAASICYLFNDFTSLDKRERARRKAIEVADDIYQEIRAALDKFITQSKKGVVTDYRGKEDDNVSQIHYLIGLKITADIEERIEKEKCDKDEKAVWISNDEDPAAYCGKVFEMATYQSDAIAAIDERCFRVFIGASPRCGYPLFEHN